MNSYETYLQMNNILAIEEAMEIYNEMKASLAQCKINGKEDIIKQLIESACYYANIRAGWEYMTKEEKMKDDDIRTSSHNTFIMNIDIAARMVGNEGLDAEWRTKLGNDRKKIGDFACFISWITAINNR